MTTNVLDMQSLIMTTDSRWSAEVGDLLFYLDDSGCDKISIRGNNEYAFIFAGDGLIIQAWKDWIASNQKGSTGMPAKKDDPLIAMCIVNLQDFKIEHEHGQAITHPVAKFAGTGAKPANFCWKENKDAKQAVESAKKHDVFSGGNVTFFEFTTLDNNLKNTITIQEVNRRLSVGEGMVMNKNDFQTATPIMEAAANDENVRNVMAQLADGTITASAPCDAMYGTWNDEDIEKLTTVFDRIFA